MPQSRILLGCILVVTLALFLASGTAQATIYYVSTQGNNSNSCTTATSTTLTSAKRTITGSTGGFGCLSAGDTLYIRAGTYTENLINPAGGGGESTRVTIAGYPGETITIRPSGGDHVIAHTQAASSYVTYDNLVVDAANVTYNCVKITYNGNNTSDQANHITFTNSELKNSPQTCIFPGPNDVYRNLKVHDGGGSYLDHGIYNSFANVTVENSEFYNWTGSGIQMYSGSKPPQPDNAIIRSNRLHDNGYTTQPSQATQLYLWSGNNMLVVNNLIYSSTTSGMYIVDNANSKIYNNTIVGNSKECILNNGSGTIIRNNICYQNGQGIVGGGTQSNNFTGNPGFLSVGDFHVSDSSPVRGAGVVLPEVRTDFDGRPRATPPSIGAYEAGGSGPDPQGPPPAPRNLRILGER